MPLRGAKKDVQKGKAAPLRGRPASGPKRGGTTFVNKSLLQCHYIVLNTLIGTFAVVEVTAGAMAAGELLELNKAHKDSKNTDSKATSFLFIAQVFIAGAVVGGLLQLLFSIVGCSVVLSKRPWMPKLYAAITTFSLIINLVMMCVTAFKVYQANSKLEGDLMEIIKDYSGKDSFNTYYVDRMHVRLKCCGVNGGDDIKKSAWYAAGNGGVPLSCCKLKDPNRQDDFSFKERTLVLNDILDPTCPLSPNGKSYTTEPCLPKVKQELKSPVVLGLTASILSMVIQIALITVSFKTPKDLQN